MESVVHGRPWNHGPPLPPWVVPLRIHVAPLVAHASGGRIPLRLHVSVHWWGVSLDVEAPLAGRGPGHGVERREVLRGGVSRAGVLRGALGQQLVVFVASAGEGVRVLDAERGRVGARALE